MRSARPLPGGRRESRHLVGRYRDGLGLPARRGWICTARPKRAGGKRYGFQPGRPDGRTLYNGCCGSNTVDAHDYDPATGGISNSRIFARIDAPGCYLDGAAIDEEGGYWLPIYGAGKILRFLPDGTLERTLRLPVSRPTMVAFGGDDHATMFFTTAAAQIDPRMGVAESGNGSLWAFEPGFRGLPEPTFRAFSEGK